MFKNVNFWACLGTFGPDLGKFGPTEKFRSTLIESAYYTLTFNEEIRKNIKRFLNEYDKGQFWPESGSNLTILGPI